ncbi:MAG: hypothetical protein U1F43_16225 [Myxococcota bacterium]
MAATPASSSTRRRAPPTASASRACARAADAEERGDDRKADAARRDQGLEEQAGAVGLGGRERRAGGAAERARSNVQRRLTHALQQVRAASPALGEHLARSVRTGTFCVYAP